MSRVIRQLDKEVVDRIAAGEVIERPSSVVKELVENALDAGARRIEVELLRGGKELIRVRDDGGGMSREDLELAFMPHATSKLTAVDDLLAIASYGFRGEALASIGAVSRSRIISGPREAGEASEVSCEGGALGSIRPAGAPPGTTVEVRNLFFNVPARARFMKGDPAETSRCLDHLIRIALAEPSVSCALKSEGRTLFDAPQGSDRRERLAIAYGRELAAGLIEAGDRVNEIRVEALLGTPSLAKGRATHQFLFLNGRLIRDATVHAAIRQAYREFLAPSLQPVYLVAIGIDPAEVDVNVHPAKTEVRFRDSRSVFQAVQRVTRDALRAADLAPRAGSAPFTGHRGPLGRPRPGPAADLPLVRESRGAPYSGASSSATPREESPSEPRSPIPAAGESTRPGDPVAAVPQRTGHGFLRLFSTYLLYESAGELVLVDQHALHERVLYERLRTEFEAGELKRQRLLIPLVLEVGRPEVVRIEEHADELLSMGLEVTAMGETEVAVHSVPALLCDADVSELLRAALVEDPLTVVEDDPLRRRLFSMACHGSVRAGDHLQDSEIEALLSQAERLPEAKACPHGRPTSVRLTETELERWFKRSGF